VAAAQAAAAESPAEEEDEEEGPEFRKLIWKKDRKQVEEALVDDEVMLYLEVKNIADGETVNVTIYEHDEDKDHDHIKDMSGEVKDGKVEIPWKVEYHADDDDSNCAEEIEKYGYTVPEYFFIAEYNGVESKEEPPKLLHVKGWVKAVFKYEDTDNAISNRKIKILLPNGTEITEITDSDGKMNKQNLPLGKIYYYFTGEENG